MEKSKEARTKAEVIRGFLDHHQPKLPEARGFLQFLLAKEEILRRLEIVDELDGCSNAILVSAKGSGAWPFFYRRGERFFHKTSQAVVELMKYVPEPLCLCLSTAPGPWTEEQRDFVSMMTHWRDAVFVGEVERLNRRFELLHRIDDALARGDQEGFLHLTRALRNLEP